MAQLPGVLDLVGVIDRFRYSAHHDPLCSGFEQQRGGQEDLLVRRGERDHERVCLRRRNCNLAEL
jgi:hypothetical protein